MSDTSRVPTSPGSNRHEGWSLETAIDHLLALISEKYVTLDTLINGNDRRYQQRFEASEKALDLGFSGQKSAVDAAFTAQKSAIDAAFSAQKEAISAALAAADRAVTKAELATEKRFESVNEFRGTLDNQQRTLIPRSEVEVLMRGVEEKIATISKILDELKLVIASLQSERVGIKGGWGYAAGVVGFLLALGSLAMIGIKFVSTQ